MIPLDSKYFHNNKLDDVGVISYLVNKKRFNPKFTMNSNPKEVYSFDPIESYTKNTTGISFDTYADDCPYVIIDFSPFFVFPTFYSFYIKDGTTPPTEWTISGSNAGNPDNDNEWETLSHPSKNTSICDEMPGSTFRCGTSTYVGYNTDAISKYGKGFNFIRIKILDIRTTNNIINHYTYRIVKPEYFGYLTRSQTYVNTCKIHYSRIGIISYAQILLFSNAN